MREIWGIKWETGLIDWFPDKTRYSVAAMAMSYNVTLVSGELVNVRVREQ